MGIPVRGPKGRCTVGISEATEVSIMRSHLGWVDMRGDLVDSLGEACVTALRGGLCWGSERRPMSGV